MQRILICGLIMTCLLAGPAQAQWEYDVSDLPALIEMLQSDQPVVRQLGATGIGFVGTDAAEAAAELVSLLDDEDEQVRLAAAWALGRFGDITLSPLFASLTQDEPLLYTALLCGYNQSASPPAILVPSIVDYIQGDTISGLSYWDGQIIAKLIEFTSRARKSELEPAAALLAGVADLESSGKYYTDETDLLFAVARQLSLLGDDAVPALLDGLNHDNADVRAVSVRALGGMGADSLVFLPRFIGLLGDESYFVQWNCAGAIGSLGPAAVSAAPGLLADVTPSEDFAERWPVSGSLAGIGAPAVPSLVGVLLDDPDEERRHSAARALELMGPSGREALPALLDAMQNDGLLVGEQAARAVAAIAILDTDAVAALIEMLESGSLGGRAVAALALGEMRPPAVQAVPALARAVNDPNAGVRSKAVLALSKLAPPDQSAIDALLGALADPQLRFLASSALLSIGGEAVPALTAALSNENASIRLAAAGILGDLGTEAAESIPALADCLSDDDVLVRQRAAQSMGRIGGSPEVAVPALLAACRGDDYVLIVQSIEALGNYGENATEAIPLLSSMLALDDVLIQQAAAAALGKINPAGE